MRIGALTVAVALAMVGCDRKTEQAAADEKPEGAAVATTPSAPGVPDAVAAVQHSPGTPLAQVSFVIETRPVAGQPFALKVMVSSAEPQPAVQLTAESTSLVAAPASTALTLEGGSKPVVIDLVVTPPKEGLAELSLRLQAEEGVETVYTIPVLVSAAD